jgi:hypothetical protein
MRATGNVHKFMVKEDFMLVSPGGVEVSLVRGSRRGMRSMALRSLVRIHGVGLAIVIGLAVFADAASATRFAFSSATFRDVYHEMTFGEESRFMTVICPVTLEGSLHSRTLSKVSGSLVGYVSTARVAEASCRGGRARFDSESLPWEIAYESFTGFLPEIERVRYVYFGLKTEREARTIIGSTITCIYRSSIIEPVIWTVVTVNGVITKTDVSGRIRPTAESPSGCPRLDLSAEGEHTVAGETRTISVTLVR